MAIANKLKKCVFGGTELSTIPEIGMLILRVFAGLSLALAHGMGKFPPSEQLIGMVGNMGFPAPMFFAWMVVFAECVCGFLLALGLATRPAAFFIAFNMAVAAFVAHADDPFSRKELALLYGAIAVMYLFVGAGKFSIDRFIRK